MKEDKTMQMITITMEEYKELLMIKGRYEELKSRQTPFYPSGITYRGLETPIEPYKVTCGTYEGGKE